MSNVLGVMLLYTYRTWKIENEKQAIPQSFTRDEKTKLLNSSYRCDKLLICYLYIFIKYFRS